MAKALGMIGMGAILIGIVVTIKYKPVYEVELAGEKLGYIENKKELEANFQEYIEDTTGNIVFKEPTVFPEYTAKFVNKNKQTQENEIRLALENTVKITYRAYAVMVDGEKHAVVSTEEEAKSIVETLKSDVDADMIGLNLGIVEEYSDDFSVQSQEEATDVLNTIKIAKIVAYNEEQEAKRKAEKNTVKKDVITTKTVESVGTIAGIKLVKPISGMITSRYGSRSSIRSGSHTGLDIGASSGTPIRPIAGGTVSFAARKGSYGNLVIIDHGNGIESYYAHCSQIYLSSGQTVDTDTVIAAVGSTGNSTGPHLHLEIRQNGKPLDPEDYLY